MIRFPRSAPARVFAVAIGLWMLAAPQAHAGQSAARFLAKEDILLYGLGLKVEPAQQTVPKDIATIVGTFLQAPQLPDNLPAFAADAEVVATLRGPSLPQPIELHVKPNSPFNIPPLGVAGTHTLDNIRLVSNGVVLLRGTPDSTRIDVIDKLLVTQVTSRALTAQEIREKGIVFDKSNFQAYNFAAAFAIQDHPVNINFTVVLPTVQGAADVSVSQAALPTVPTPSIPSLKTIIPDTLKLQTQIPNLTVVGFTLTIPELKGQDFGVPPIPGVIVIPGDIGFLNQYFSVMLMVSNVAPGGSHLVVTGLRATIVLPPGRDGVVGSPDDPLAMARLATGEGPRIQPILQLGLDGVRGTSDDVDRLGPQETGNAEYLVEGRREGSHVVEMQITGTLEGLPVGPVTVSGRAAGSVLVRNPKFTLTFTHPDVVSAGEPYSLDVTVTNTSDSPANFVSVSLHGQDVSGATLVGDATRDIEAVAPGDSETVSFDLISKLTGKVTAATLDSDANVAGRFALKTAVGELGVPLSPDSLVLPPEANGLPKPLRTAAIGLLGKAYAVATAPAAALPRDIRRFTRQIVIDGAVQVAEAGLRVSLHESIPDSALQLAMDFAGSDYARLPAFNPKPEDLAFAQNDRIGFDELRRRSVRGDTFAQAVASILVDSVSALGPSEFHRQIAEKVADRPGHISVMVGGAGPLPFELTLVDGTGRQVGGTDASGKVLKQIPFSDLMRFTSGGVTTATLALVTTPDPGNYVIRLDPIAGIAPSPVTVSLVLPAADGVTLRRIVFDGVTSGSAPMVPVSPGDPFRFTVRIGGGDPSTAVPMSSSIDAAIVEPPPAIVGVLQQALADALKCEADEKAGVPAGRVIAVLFSKEVTVESAQDKATAENITNYTSATNRVLGVALQPGRRIVYLAMRDPVGPYVPEQLTISGVSDVHGHVMPQQTLPIETTIEGGGVVSGRVLQADGTPVPNANVRLFYLLTCGEPHWVGISSKLADAAGHYSWNFVGNSLPDRIVAVDEGTGEFRDVRFNVQRTGQQLTVDIVLLGRGTLQGRTLSENGAPLRDTAVRVTSLTDRSQYGATTDADGRFSIARIPVGSLLIEAVNVAARAKTFISQAIPSAGATIFADLVLLTVESPTQATLKTGTVAGTTLGSDGVSPVRNVPVIAWYQSGSQAGIFCPTPGECAVAVGNSDSTTGAYRLEGVTAGTIRLQTFDQTSLRQGEARVILPADGTITANLLLAGGVGTVRGSVLDALGRPVPNARVGGGLSLTTTDASGQFTLDDVPVGHRDIVAVSDALGGKGIVGIDLLQAGETVGATIVLPSTGSVAGTVFEADRVTPIPGVPVHLFTREAGSINVVGSVVSDAGGHYRFDNIPVGEYQASAFRSDFTDGNIRAVPLQYFNQVARGDIIFRGGGGTITGVALDDDGQTPLKAAVSVSGDQLVIAGGRVGVEFKYVQNYKIAQTDFTTGRYQFSGIWVGKATIRAAGQFSPDPIALDATMPSANAVVTLDIRLKATSRLTGTVYQPDGVTPAGPNLIVTFKSDEVRVVCSETSSGDSQCRSIPQGIQEEHVVTDANGEFLVPVVNAGAYTVRVEDPATGQIGIAHGSVRAGEDGHVTVRLLGQGTVTVVVKGSDGATPIPTARVVLEQTDYPKRSMTVITDPSGTTVFSGGDALTEGPFTVMATDRRNGFAGRAAGKVTRDGEQVTVTVYLYDAWGTVTGHVFRRDGLTAVPFSDVVVSNAAGPLVVGLTDATGAFIADYIPIGPVSIETFEAATARIGSAVGRVDVPRQTVPIDVVENALGLVKGVVLQSGSLTPLKGWEVSLSQALPSGRALPTLRTTTSIDGSYAFPGASEGLLSLRAARDGVDGTATAQTRLTREGQVIDVPLVATIAKALTGNVIGKVYNADGTPGADALVQVCQAIDCTEAEGVTVTAVADGTFGFDNLPLGRFVVRARSQITHDAGASIGEIRFDGETTGITVALKGLTTIAGIVFNGDGSVAAGAKLELTGLPSSDCQGPCVEFALSDGTFRFVGVSASSFTIVATGAVSPSRGVVGDRLTAGETHNVTIRLEPFGQLTGRVLLPGGSPAANIVAELVFGARHLFAQSGADGRFSFAATPLGAYALTLQDPIGAGIVSRTGAISGPTTLADVVLDVAPPTVVSVSPAPSATAVPRATTVRITFSEAIDPGSATQANVTLSDGVRTIDGTLQSGAGDTTLTFTPLAPLQDETRFTLRVADIRDRVGKTLATAYVTSFTTVDITPPRAIVIDPAPATSGVTVDMPVRIKYSEAIDPAKFAGRPIAVSGAAGPVDGRIDYLFSNTTVVFTPNRPFADGATYTVIRAAATDRAGIAEAPPAAFSFSTTDRTPPVITGLLAPPTVIENGRATVVADLGPGSDVALVDFYINGVFSVAARSAPFTLTFQALPAYGTPGDTIRISALATDTSGNRSLVPAATALTVIADASPHVTLTVVTPTGELTAHNNDFVVIKVRATDDLGVAQIGYKALTGNPLDGGTRSASIALDRTESFAFHLPADAAPGSTVRVQASASDTKGQVGQAAPVDILVLDAIAPVVTITGATTGAMVNPGQQTTIAVLVKDSGGVASITLTVTGVAQLTQTRVVDPPQLSAITSFTFTIPATAKPTDSVSIVATAVDRAGNVGTSGNVVLPVSDRTSPSVTLRTANGLSDVGAGTPLVILADADDDLSVASIELTGSGAFAVAQSRAFSPALASARGDFRFDIPASVPDGATITLLARAIDLAGNVSPPATLTLTIHLPQTLVLPGSVLLKAGESASVNVAIPGGASTALRVDVTSDNADIATVTPSVLFAVGETSKPITVTGESDGTAQIAASVRGVPGASMTASVRGGIVTGIVTDDRLRPVAGAAITVSGGVSLSAISAADGSYSVEGVAGPEVSVRATDPDTHLYGFTTGTMNRRLGHADISVVMTTAASIAGVVFESDALTPAGPGVRVDIYEPTDLRAPRATAFTDDLGAYGFPFVQLGEYVLDATGRNGERARATIRLEVSAEQASVPLRFLGQGTVVGTVVGGLGLPVNAAAVSFHASSVVGSSPEVQATTDSTGTFRFEGALVGQFWLTARDPATGQAGSISGLIARAGDTVTADVHLASYAALAGTVYRADRTTTVAGATVTTTNYRTTTTDEAGGYQFDILPLGPIGIRVDDGGARGKGVASATLANPGTVQTLDVVLFPQGSVVVTVRDANGAAVSNANVYLSVTNGSIADSLYARAGLNGIAVIDRVLAGTFDIRADNGVLKGTALNRRLAAGETQQVSVQLQPTGGIAGLVAEPDGLTPATGGRVYIRRGDFSVVTAPIGDDGRYRFDALSLDQYGYELDVYDAAGRFRAFAKRVPVRRNAEIVTQDFTFVGLGQVRGEVRYAATGATAPDFSVTVQTRHPDFTAARSARTNAAGFYEINDVPVGRFTASTGDLGQQLWGEGDGTLVHSGDVAEINILLQNNAIALPATRSDANNFAFDVQSGGTIAVGSAAFSDALALDVIAAGVPYRFSGGEVPTVEQSGREIVTRQNGIAGLNVTRKLFVPLTGYFARALEFFSNPTADPITVDVRVTNGLASGVTLRATSSGDNVVAVADAATADRWVMFDDALDADPAAGGRPAVGFVFDGENARLRAGSAAVLGGSPARLQLGWPQITVPPGGTVALMHFAVQQTTRESMAASTDRLVRLAPEALEGMTPEELAAVANFAVPADGHSTVPALPSLTGAISGRVFEGDGATTMPFTAVSFKSSNVLFGRTHTVVTDAAGAFVVASTLDDGASRAVPIDGFVLTARHPVTNVVSPSAAGVFAPDAVVAERNVVFNNTAMLSGAVTRHTGAAVTTGTVRVSLIPNGAPIASAAIGGDARYRVTGLPPGTYVLAASIPHPQGSALVGTGSATVTAGQATIADVTIQATGSITGTLSTANGTAVAGVFVSLANSTGTVSRQASTDTGGAFTLTDVPAGAVTLSATDPTTGIRMSAPAAVAVDATTTAALKFPAVGRLDVQVNFQRGAAAPAAPLQLQEAVRGTEFRGIGSTDAGGHKTMNGLSAGAFVVRATHPDNARIVASVAGTLAVDGSAVPVTITLPAAATVHGVVTDSQGAVAGIAVTVRSANASFGGFQTATTDTAGAYAIAGVPDGAFTATVQEFGRQLFGEVSGRIDSDGQDVTANISLINNAVSLPADRFDANGLQYQIAENGRIGAAANNTFGYYWQGGTGASRLEIVANGVTIPFTGASVGTMEQDGREIVVRQAGVAGLSVTRKVFVPRDGYFARYLELLTNPTTTPITVDLRVRSTVSDLDYYPRTLDATSSGDAMLDVSDAASPDRWVTFDDSQHRDPFSTGGPVPTAFVFDGVGAALRASSVTAVGSQAPALTYEWNSLTVPAGQTVGVMHYVVEQVSAAGAAAAATRLSLAPPEAIDGLSPEEIGAIRNFALPADGVSPLAPLPSLAGMVTGRVLGSDGATLVPNAPMTFKSLHPLFGRVIELQSDGSGTFALKSFVNDYNHRSVPVGPFTLHARHPATYVEIDQAGDFIGTFTGNVASALGQATASSFYPVSYYAPQNAIDADPDSSWYTETAGETHWLEVGFPGGVAVSRVTMSSANLLSARIDLFDAAGQVVASVPNIDTSSGTVDVAVDGEGIRRVRVTDEANSYWVMVRDLRVFGSAAASAGVAQQDVAFTNTGTAAVTVRRFNGAAVTAGSVNLHNPSGVNMSLGVSTSGVATFTGLAAGSYVASASSGFLTGAQTFDVTIGSTTAVDVRLSPTGTIRGTVTRGNGAPSIGSLVRVRGLYPTSLLLYASADGSGQYAFADLPLGSFEVIAYEPYTGYPIERVSYLSTADEVVRQDFTLVGLGTVNVHARYASGGPVVGTYVRITPAWGGASNVWSTDANGDLTVSNVIQGPFSVRLAHPQNGSVYADASGTIAGDGDVQSIAVTLPAVASVIGTVTRPDGTAVPYPDVVVQGKAGIEWGPSAKDADGHFTFTAMPANQALTVRAYWGAPYPYRTFYGETPFTLSGNADTETVDVRLPGFAKITIHLTRDDGVTPWAGAIVYSSDKFRPFYQARGTTDANGNLTLQRRFNDVTPDVFPEGDIALRVYDPNTGAALVDAIVPIRLADVNGTVSVTIDARLVAGSVTGHVYAADGVTPVNRAQLVVLNALDLKQLGVAYSGADGSYSFANVRPGQQGFIVRANSPDFSVVVDHAGAFVTAGETQQVDIVLPITAAAISGHLFAGDGQTPLNRAYVQLFDGDGNYLQYVTVDSSGGYSFGWRYFNGLRFSVEAYEYSSGVVARVAGTIPASGGPVTVDVTLPVSVVHGRVSFADGTAVRYPTVIVVQADGRSQYADTTVDGGYTVFGIPAGDIVVTAQDESSGLNASEAASVPSDAMTLTVDVQLPPSGTVTGTITGVNGLPVPNTWVSLVSPNLEFIRNAAADATGQFRFTHVPAGNVYVQAVFQDDVASRYVGNSGTVVAGETLTLPLASTGGGTVTGEATAAGGGPAGGVLVALRGFAGMGPNGIYSAVAFDGSYTFHDVPPGRVQLVVYAWKGGAATGPIGIADGDVTVGGTLTLNVALGNGVDSSAILDGDDGFRYDVSSNGTLGSGGTVDGRLRSAYSGADLLQVNGLDFPTVDAARPAASARELSYGPVPVPDVQVTRAVFVPQSGGFARYLETFINATAVPQTITVSLNGNTGSGDPRIVVAPASTGNTFTVTDFPNCDCDTPTLARVFQGSGTPPLTVSTLTMRRDHFSFTYQLTLAPGAAVTLMHFEVQRGATDAAGAEAQAQALVDLTDPQALDGMSQVDRARVLNFVIPR